MKLLNTHAFVLFGVVLLVAAVPNSAHARSSVHIDVPGFSIGWYDQDRHYRKRHHRPSRHHYDRYYDNYYYDEYRPRRHHRKHKRYHKKYYNNHYYHDNRSYYPRDRYYDRPRVVEICPTAGYSRYRDRNRSCYQHKDHYHCD